MRLQVTLALMGVLYPTALAIQCYVCSPLESGACKDTQTSCPDKCASMTTTLSLGNQRKEFQFKSCEKASECVSGSLNMGLLKIYFNTKCCSTNLCNSQPAPALPIGSTNGRQCYSCTGDDCTGTMSCEGDEDQCISSTATVGAVHMVMKGCVTTSLCTANVTSMLQAAGFRGDMSCCKGDLCNGAAGVKLSLLIMLVPLFSILFI